MILEHDPRSTSNIAILRSGEFSACGNFDLISKKISMPSFLTNRRCSRVQKACDFVRARQTLLLDLIPIPPKALPFPDASGYFPREAGDRGGTRPGDGVDILPERGRPFRDRRAAMAAPIILCVKGS